MQKLKVLDLFSGIGGFSLGLERTGGFETVAFCEIEASPRRVLAKHWPNVTVYKDIRDLSADRLQDAHGKINGITGGFPCQDLSTAGRGAGIDGEKSGLWYHLWRLTSEIRPDFLLLENVANLLVGDRGNWFKRVLGDLAQIGYDAEWHCIPASYVGAPHIRDRVWLISYPNAAENNISTIRRVFSHDKMPRGDSRGTWREAMPNISRVDDGLPNRMDRLGNLGNAVVPAIPEMLGYAILERFHNYD